MTNTQRTKYLQNPNSLKRNETGGRKNRPHRGGKNSVKLGILNTTELFSGILQDENTQEEAPVLVTEETKYFQRTLTASRNVAGLMIYVENIPAQVESNAAGDVSTVPFTPTSLSVVATGITTETLIRQKQAPADAEPLTYQTLGTIDLTPQTDGP